MKLTEKQQAHIAALVDKRGGLKPSDVVEDAKRKSSPLHSLFVWDLKKAAQQHWMQTAREIIGSVTVLYQRNDYSVKAPLYVRDPQAKGEGYRSVAALQDDPVNARESLIYTLEVAAGHLKRAFDLAAPLGLSNEVDTLLAQVAGLQRLAKKAA